MIRTRKQPSTAIHILKNTSWYVDPKAEEKGEPGLCNTFIASVATALQRMGVAVDPSWLMGTSGFAFRILVNEIMCPSAMSVFDWSAILPEAMEQADYHCIYVSRLWHETDKEEAFLRGVAAGECRAERGNRASPAEDSRSRDGSRSWSD